MWSNAPSSSRISVSGPRSTRSTANTSGRTFPPAARLLRAESPLAQGWRSSASLSYLQRNDDGAALAPTGARRVTKDAHRSEEHTSKLQSLRHLVCRLLLEKKKNNK